MKTKSFIAIGIVLSSVLVSCYMRGPKRTNIVILHPPSMHRDSDAYGMDVEQTVDVYKPFTENDFISSKDAAVSSFSTDADGASYSNIRRYILTENTLPPKNAIRTEELINYFDMHYQEIRGTEALGIQTETCVCPWKEDHTLLRIGIKGKTLKDAELLASNFVFLVDVSGSMDEEDKLALLKEGLLRFVAKMRDGDKVAIVTYAGYSRTVLKSTFGKDRVKIIEAIQTLNAQGSTDGSQGIITAYQIAGNNFIQGGNNRIILGTDGDFNMGITDLDSLVRLMEIKRESGIYLTVLGFGHGNLNDANMEQMADNGNGNYYYIDKKEEIEKVFVEDYHCFYTIAKDVKIQVKFNPAFVDSYRLIGYENRLMSKDEFLDEKKDAGELSSGQSLTALYELILKKEPKMPLEHIAIIDLRYKNITDASLMYTNIEVNSQVNSFQNASNAMKLCAGISAFSMLLRESKYVGKSNYKEIQVWLEPIRQWGGESRIEELIKIVQVSSNLKR